MVSDYKKYMCKDAAKIAATKPISQSLSLALKATSSHAKMDAKRKEVNMVELIKNAKFITYQ